MKKICKYLLCALFSIAFISLLLYDVNASDDKLGTIYDRTLYSETNTYNFNDDYTFYDKHAQQERYDLSNKNSNAVSNNVLLTVLTHGLGGDASHWSSRYNRFEYEDNTILSSLSKLLDNNLNIYRFRVNFDELNISKLSNDFHSEDNLDHITDIAKHIVIVFDINYTSSYRSNDYVYDRFNYAISTAVYQIKQLNNGFLPKINLIGHSRGGITNLQYALDHPDLVNQIFSIGTPYEGSSSTNIDVYTLNHKYGSDADLKIYDGEDDIIDKNIYTEYLNRWNNNYEKLYKDIKVYSIGCYTSFDCLIKIINSNNFIEFLIGEDASRVKKVLLKILSSFVSIIGSSIAYSEYGIKVSVFLKIFPRWFEFLPDSKFKAICELIELIFSKENYYDLVDGPIWANDGLVDLDSQLGVNYKGFIQYRRCFCRNNYDMSKLASETLPPVVHNMETKDRRVINYILENIEINNKPNDDYLTYEVSDNEVGISLAYVNNQNGVLTIPSVIDGKNVVEIADSAFFSASQKKIIIPASIRKISPNAFVDFTDLEEINIESDISLDDLSLFYSFPKLKKIYMPNSSKYSILDDVIYTKNMNTLLYYPLGKEDTTFDVPRGVLSIQANAITNKYLKNIKLNDVLYVGSNAFNNCINLKNICTSELRNIERSSIDTTKWFYDNKDKNGIISLGKVVIKCNGDNIFINDNYISIADYAFEKEILDPNEKNITVHIDENVKMISDNAFVGIDNLTLYLSAFEIDNIKDTFLDVSNLEFHTSDIQEEYYQRLLPNQEIKTFDGKDLNGLTYNILRLRAYISYEGGVEPTLYYKDKDIRCYEDESIDIKDESVFKYRDPRTGYDICVLDSLYEDVNLERRVNKTIIPYDECMEYYAKWNKVLYRIIWDYNGGVGDRNETICGYYSDQGFPSGKKAYCDSIEYWKLPDGSIHYDYDCVYMYEYLFHGYNFKENYIKLTAKWEETKYKITYHLDGGKTEIKYYTYYETTTLYKPNINHKGWFDNLYRFKYEDTFVCKYHEDLDLYERMTMTWTISFDDRYRITDAGKFKNSFDLINLYEYFGYTLSELKEYEYKYIKINIDITVREEDDGYQWIYIYSDYINSNSYKLCEVEFEHGVGHKDTSEYVHSFSFEIQLSELLSDNIYVLYDASGKNSDTWITENRDISVSVYLR